jgi:hypothetical protein
MFSVYNVVPETSSSRYLSRASQLRLLLTSQNLAGVYEGIAIEDFKSVLLGRVECSVYVESG